MSQNSIPLQPKSATVLRGFVWLAVVCSVAMLLWSWYVSPRRETSSTLVPGDLVRLAAFDRGGKVPVGLRVSVQQVLNSVNLSRGWETEAEPLPCFEPFKIHGEVQCFKDRSEDCYLMLTGDPTDVQLISVCVKTGHDPTKMAARRARRYDLFDQVIERTVAAIDPDLVTDVRHWAIKSIPLAMQNEAGTFAEWGRWMTKVKFDESGPERYFIFLIGLPETAERQAVVAVSGVVHMH